MAGKKKASKGGKKTSKSASGKASKFGSGKVKEGKWEAAPVSDEPMPLVGIIDHIVSVQVCALRAAQRPRGGEALPS